MGTSSSWQVSFIFHISRCALLKSLWSYGFLKIETSSVSACIWETCISRVTWSNTDLASTMYPDNIPQRIVCLFVLLRIRVSSFRELLWQMLQERRALSCWAARDLDSPLVPAADFTASQLCSQSATRASLRGALVCVEY